MPPVIVGIAAGVAAAGVVSTAAAIAIGIGAAALTYAATPKFDGGSFANEAFSQQQMLRSPVEPRRGIYGRAMVSGPLVFAEETGTDNAYLHLVIPLAGHRCDGIEKIYFGDDVAWANGALTAKYASVARIKIHLGNQTTSDPDLTAECRQWTSAHVGFGVTYLYARLKFDTKVFPNGVPNIKALVRGKQVYDPRKTTHNWSDPATWEWSDNWALCCLDYNRFEAGVGAAAHEIDLSYFAAAANDSDQLVEYKTGKFEKRYTCNGTYNTDVSPSSIMEKMLTAGAGMHVYVSGQYRLYAGVYQGPEVLVLTEDDAAGDIDVRPYTPRSDLCNAVRGTFVDPENFYQPTDFPPYESSYYRAQDDGEYIDHDLDLPFTQSVWTAQRLGKLYLEQKRAGMQISMPVKMIGVAVSVGKVVGLSLPRLGIDGTFQIVDWQFDYGKPVSLILVETSPELFDYAMGSYTERDLTPNVILPNPATVPTPVGLQYVEYQDDPQWQGELTWSAPANNSSYRYVIEVSNGLGEVVYQTNADSTRLLLPKFDAGFYTVSVWALNLFANRSNAPATITIGATLPAPVTGIEVIAGPLTLTLRPTTAAAIAQTTQFEILGSITNNIADAALIGTGKDAVWPDRHPNTRYQVWARTINNYGASSWYGPVQATTSADNSSIIDLIGNTFKSYTWFAWADDNQGTGFTTVEALGNGKAYMGLATDKPTASPSGNWQDYTWTKIKTEIPPVFTQEEEAKLDNLMAGKLPFAPDKDMLAAQDALNNPALANNLITALSLLNQGINAPALGGETPSGAQSKASSAQSAAIAAAATDATTKANNAKALAEANAALDALNKANTAKADAITTAASDATTKANNAKAAAESYALAKANLAETTAKAYADGIVSDEEARAIADAQAKADAAKSAAIAAAAADATSKANNARAQAEANAALDALNKANTAKDDAINTASTDATNKIGALKIGGTNLVENSLINADSTSYGFANRVVNLVSGREYVFSAAGYVSQKALDEGHNLVIYIYIPDWSFSKKLSISTLSESVKDVTFVAPSTGSYSINSYLYPNGGTRTGTVHCSWYKLEEGNKPTAWAPAPVDLENYALNQAAQAQSNATASAALDALNKANAAKADAISTASTDATTKANNAKTQAISSAATDATTKADAAKAAAIAAAAADATTKANNAKAQAEANAALDALNKANTAKADAISTAATDATTKANNAQSAAIAAAAADATTKANNAKAQAEANAALDALNKANTAKADAISTAATDATTKANSALTAANAELDNRINATEAAALDNLFNISGLPYRKDIVIGGDSNKYYPVVFWGGSQDVNRRIKIWRAYFETAPNDWYSSTHKGQLTIDWLGNFGGWGGAGYFDQLLSHRGEYTELLGDLFRFGSNQAYCFMLRGGGAIYHFASDLNVFPEVYYNQDLLHAASNTYAPAPSTTVNSERILYAKLGNASFGNLLAYSGQFTALKSRLGNFGGLTAETIAALAIATNHLQAGAVTVDKVSANAITAEKIAALAIATNHLQAGAVTVDKVSANAITAEKIAALAIATNHLQAGVVTADKITADTALIQKLIANVGLFNQLQAQLGVFGGLAANSIAAGAITVDKLDVRARNLVNNVSQTGVITGWSGGVVVDHIHKGKATKALEVSSASNTQIFSDLFDIDHTKIYEVNFTIHRVSGGANGTRYLGMSADGDGYVQTVYPSTRSIGSSVNNFYFWTGAIDNGQYRQMRAYIIGSEVDPASIPESLNVDLCCLLNPSTKQVRLRALNYYNNGVTTVDRWLNMSVTEIGGGQISANQLLANSALFNQLKAKIGAFGGLTANEIQADSALINKLVATSALFDSLVARLAVFGGITSNAIAAGAITADKLQVSSQVNNGGVYTNFKIQPDNVVPIRLSEVSSSGALIEDIFYVDRLGNGFFKGLLSKDTVDINAIQDEARKQINPFYLGTSTGNKQEILTSAQMANGATTSLPAVTVNGGKVNVSFKLSGGSFTTSGSIPALPADPQWRVDIYRGSTSGTLVFSKTYTGSSQRYYESEIGVWEVDTSISIEGSFSDSGASASQVYVIKTTLVAGTVTSLTRRYFGAESPNFLTNTLSKNQNGYWMDKETGFIIQWGQLSMMANQSVTVTLPIAFPNAIMIALADNMENYNASSPTHVYAKTKTSISLINSPDSTVTVQWMAYGY